MSNSHNSDNNLTFKRWFWLIWLVILVLSAYVIPYVFIGGIVKITASFLFWTVFALVAIFSTIKIISYWRD